MQSQEKLYLHNVWLCTSIYWPHIPWPRARKAHKMTSENVIIDFPGHQHYFYTFTGARRLFKHFRVPKLSSKTVFVAGKNFRKNQVRTGFEPLVRGSTWFRFEFGSEAEPEPEFGFEVRQKCLRTGPNRTAAALHCGRN